MPSVAASKQWTLRLKNGTQTVLLFADPAQSLTSLKQALLRALESAPPADPHAPKQPLPATASDIEVAKPIDRFNLARGWQLLGGGEAEDDELAENTSKGKGKGKARANGTSVEKSLSSWGVKDNYALAWRIKTLGETDETMGEEDAWNVVIPTFDEYEDEPELP